MRLTISLFTFSCCVNNVGFISVYCLARGGVVSGQLICVHGGAGGLVGLPLRARTLGVLTHCGKMSLPCLFPILSSFRGARARRRGHIRGIVTGIGVQLGGVKRRLGLPVSVAACITQRSFTAMLGESNIDASLVYRALKRDSRGIARVCLSDFRGDRVSTTVRGLL